MALVQQDLGHHDPEPVLAGLQPAGGDYRGGLCRPVRRRRPRHPPGGGRVLPALLPHLPPGAEDRRPGLAPVGRGGHSAAAGRAVRHRRGHPVAGARAGGNSSAGTAAVFGAGRDGVDVPAAQPVRVLLRGAEPDGGPVLDRPSALQRPAGADDGRMCLGLLEAPVPGLLPAVYAGAAVVFPGGARLCEAPAGGGTIRIQKNRGPGLDGCS